MIDLSECDLKIQFTLCFFTDVEEDVFILLEEFKDCKVGIQWGHQAYHNSFHCIARG